MNITKGIILAGGKGTRLAPLTNITNKELLAVYDRPMIEFPLETLKKIGCNEILIICNREFGGDFIRYLGSGEDRGMTITYRVQDHAGGIAHAMALARGFTGNEQFALTFGDNYFEESIIIPPLNESDAMIAVGEVSDPRRFGVVEIRNDIIVGVEEKPENPKSNIAILGFYIFPPDVYDVISKLKPSARGELEITHAVEHYVKNRHLRYSMYSGEWSDMGTVDSLARTVARRIEISNAKQK